MPETSVENREDQPDVIVLDSSMTIADVATLKDMLKCYADSEQDLALDGSQVETIDTVSMQLLLAFIKQLESNDCVVSWQEPSTAICNSAQLLGLEQKLGLDCRIT